MENKELTTTESRTAQFIEQAIAKGLPVETMERLFALHEKAKAGAAKDAFVSALAGFQKDVPVIEKKRKVMDKDGIRVRYKYASLDDIIEQIKKPLADNGISYSWEVENKEGIIRAIAKATHIAGHTETSAFEIPIDKGGFMTEPQKYASALTYAKRYSLCNVLGISTADEDTDAVDVVKKGDVKSDKSKIAFLLKALGENVTEQKQYPPIVLKWTKLELEPKNYKEIIGRLEVAVQEKRESDAQTA